MSFITRNHPQQVAVRGALDDRTTPERPPFGCVLLIWGA